MFQVSLDLLTEYSYLKCCLAMTMLQTNTSNFRQKGSCKYQQGNKIFSNCTQYLRPSAASTCNLGQIQFKFIAIIKDSINHHHFSVCEITQTPPPTTNLRVGVEAAASGTDQNIRFQMHFFSIVFQRDGKK